jgi:trehalose 6-phosphate synthase
MYGAPAFGCPDAGCRLPVSVVDANSKSPASICSVHRHPFPWLFSPPLQPVRRDPERINGDAPPQGRMGMDSKELRALISQFGSGAKIIVVSNREPWMHERLVEEVRAVRPASGMVVGLEPIVRAAGGIWVAHGSGSGDRLVTDDHGRIRLPPGNPQYTLRRVWLSRKEEDGYYYGTSNRALWPLCHIVYTRPRFSSEDWRIYRQVNQRFCETVLDEVGSEDAIVFIQDYHLALLPRMLKTARPNLKIIQFWHIPWPNREAFRILPWGEELLDGLLGNDLLGFHIQYHCNNFLDTVSSTLEAMVDNEHYRIFRGGRPTYVRPFPISVDFDQIGRDAETDGVNRLMDRFRRELGDAAAKTRLFVGADRIDYTKGIPERFKAFDLMLQRHPELLSKVTLVQLAAPSRTHVREYRELNDALDDLVDDINWRHQTEDWKPIHFLRAHHDYPAVLAGYRLADVLLVTSLHDGMNLVAKEFLAARTDGDGVLVLSKYTGCARELDDALLVNPFDIDQLAEACYDACRMPQEERQVRMGRMREKVQKHNVFDWAAKIFAEAAKCLKIE